jgi:Ca-activated chloride channel homolog
MTLGAPWFLLALIGVMPLVWRIVSRRGKGRVPVPSATAFLAVPSLKATLWWVPDALRILAIVAVVFALARPRVAGAEVRSGQGVGIMLLIDMSRSMYAVDMPAKDLSQLLERGETPKNRFEIARDVLKQFIVERNKSGADRIGLVIFGQEAWLRYPLTHDHARLIRSLNELVLDVGPRDASGRCSNGCTIDGGGTAIGDALRRGYSQLARAGDVASKLMVLITDGKETGGTTPASSLARHLRDLPPAEQMRVYTFQVGGKGEMYVPQIDRLGRPLKTAGGIPRYERPDQEFEIDPDLLSEIAASTGGKYYESYNEEKFEEDIADLARTAFEAEIDRPEVDVFSWPLLVALGLIALEWLLRMSLFRSVA